MCSLCKGILGKNQERVAYCSRSKGSGEEFRKDINTVFWSFLNIVGHIFRSYTSSNSCAQGINKRGN